MKNMNQILFAAVIATTISLVGHANAQYRVTESDGIAASPKVRQMLTEQKAAPPLPPLPKSPQPAIEPLARTASLPLPNCASSSISEMQPSWLLRLSDIRRFFHTLDL